VDAPERPRLELLDEDLDDPERLEPEDFAPERAEEDFFAEAPPPADEARPVVRLDDPRPEDGPAVLPVDFADELRADELRAAELRPALDLPEELGPDFFDEADFELDLLPVDLECDFELGLEEEPVAELPPREDFAELLPRDDFEELLPLARAFSG
jgi:hypothetical protein